MKNGENNRNFALVYMDFEEGKPYWHIRIGGLETNRFPHGLGLASKFLVKENAEDFADEVEAYMKQVVKVQRSSSFELEFSYKQPKERKHD